MDKSINADAPAAENAEDMNAEAWKRFSAEVQKGFDSAERGGWLTMDEVETALGRGRSTE